MANPLWQQTIQDTVESLRVQSPEPAPTTEPTGGVPSEDFAAADRFFDDELVNMNATPLQDKPPEQINEVTRDQVDEDAPSSMDQVAYRYKGANGMMRNLEEWMLADYPELAAAWGYDLPEQREAKSGTRKIAEMTMKAFSPLNQVINHLEWWTAGPEIAKAKYGPAFMDMDENQRRDTIKTQTDTILKEQFPEIYGTEYADSGIGLIGEFAGYMADPTTLVPVGAGAKTLGWGVNTLRIATAGSMVGGSDAAVYDMAKEGVLDWQHIGMAAAAGGILGPSLYWAGRGTATAINKGIDKLGVKSTNKLLDKYEKYVLKAHSQGSARGVALNDARVAYGLSPKEVEWAYSRTGRSFELPKNSAGSRQAYDDIEERSSRYLLRNMTTWLGEKVDPIIRPVVARAADISPRIAHAMRQADATTHIRSHGWMQRVDPWTRKLKHLSKAEQKSLKLWLSTSDADSFGKAYALMHKAEKANPQKLKGLVNEFDEVRTVLKEVGVMYKGSGYKLDLMQHYFPRVVTDTTAIGKVKLAQVTRALQKASEAKGKRIGKARGKLSAKEQADVLESLIMRPESRTRVKTGGSLRERQYPSLIESMQPHYADPDATLHSYLRMAAHDTSRAEFFRKFGYKKGFMTDGSDIDKRVGEVLNEEFKRLGLHPSEEDELIDILRARFMTGENSPNKAIQAMKNLGYTGTLGNIYSAITQLGDPVFSFMRNGVRSTLKGAFTPRQISKADLGLEDAMEEIFANTSSLKKVLDFSLKWGGFNSFDKFGKDTLLNASLDKWQRKLMTPKGTDEFVAQWGKYFDKETTGLMRDVRNFGKLSKYKGKTKSGTKTVERVGAMTDNMRLMLWHELADVQPIALSEMPEKYLNHPNGRIFYMLKTFTIKQLDFMRREILQKFTTGRPKEGTMAAAKFVTFWLALNGGADAAKAAISGEEFDVKDNMIENLLQMVALNKYMFDKGEKEGFLQTVLTSFLLPPVNWIDKPVQGAMEGDLTKMAEPIPVVGKYIYKSERAKKEKAKALRDGGYRKDKKGDLTSQLFNDFD